MNALARIFDASAKAVIAFRRSFDAAPPQRDTRWPAWANQYAPARQRLAERHRQYSRAAFQVEHNPIGRAIQDQYRTHVIGDRITARSNYPLERMARTLESGFSLWSERVDVEGRADLCSFTCEAFASVVTSGEAVVRHVVDREARYRAHNLSPEQLDASRTRELQDMMKIVAGVEFDVFGQRVAYHIFPQAPDLFGTMTWAPMRVPASEISHIFESRTPGQVRGTSWFAPVLEMIWQIQQLQDNLLQRSATIALFGAFVTDPSGTSGFGEGSRDPQELSLEPGVIRILPPDATVNFPDVPDAGGMPELLKHMIRQVATGVHMPYELLSGDLSSTNYSSAKLGLETFKRRCRAIRETLLINGLLRPMWRRWVTVEVLSGRLYAPDFERNPEPYFDVSFLFPDWASLDPYREAQADVALLDAGIRSRAEIISARGRDPAEVDAEIARDTFVPRTAPAAPGRAQLESSNA